MTDTTEPPGDPKVPLPIVSTPVLSLKLVTIVIGIDDILFIFILPPVVGGVITFLVLCNGDVDLLLELLPVLLFTSLTTLLLVASGNGHSATIFFLKFFGQTFFTLLYKSLRTRQDRHNLSFSL